MNNTILNYCKNTDVFTGSPIARTCGLELHSIIMSHILENDSIINIWIKNNDISLILELEKELAEADEGFRYVTDICDKYIEKIRLNTKSNKLAIEIDNRAEIENIRIQLKQDFNNRIINSITDHIKGITGYEKSSQRIKSYCIDYINKLFKLTDAMKSQFDTLCRIFEFKV